MTPAWLLLTVLTAASLLAAQGRWESGLAATLVVLALTWLKLRVVLVRFVGVGGGWRTGLSVVFAVLLAALLVPYALY